MVYFMIVLLSVIASLGCGEPLCDLLEKKCMRIDTCPTMQAMLKLVSRNKQRNTNYTEHQEYITNSRCGFDGNTLKVWCPGHCTTPDGRKGECLDMESCPTLKTEIHHHHRYSSSRNLKFLEGLRCAFPRDFFCCPLPSAVVNKVRGLDCSVSATALPPHPDSGCCGIEKNTDRIKGGEPTNQFTWLALIEYGSKGHEIKGVCDGSLISGRYVLTAAHCADTRISGKPWRVRLGEYNLENPAKNCSRTREHGVEKCSDGTTTSFRIKVKRSFKHPQYNVDKQHIHDIALLLLEKMATLIGYITPICLPCSDITARPPDNLKLYVVGWDSNHRISKHYLEVPYLDRDTCMARYKNRLQLKQSHICAGGEANRSDCKGDSGGPVMHYTGTHFQLVGIISRGTVQCGIEYPSIHTKVYEYLEWIKKTILKHDQSFGYY